MRKLIVPAFISLDGIIQAPGGPEEDTSGGFSLGGWVVPYADESSEPMGGIFNEPFELVLGRTTYDIFAGYWPLHTDNEIGALFDRIPKYVASRGTPELTWAGTAQLGADVLGEVDGRRDRHRDVHVIGSIDFARALFDAQLFDQLTLWVFPIVLGEGKRLFHDGTVPSNLRLLAPPVVSGTGAVLLRYAPNGVPATGVMGPQ